MKKLIILSLAAFAGLALQAGGSAGSCEAKASSISVGGQKAVTLVHEYDPDFNETDDSKYGVYYLSATLQKGHSYTVWVDSTNLFVSAYARDTTESENEKDIFAPSADFDDEAEQVGKTVLWLYGEDWESEDPSSWKYYIYLDGDFGQRATVHLAEGIQSFLPPGLEANPAKITFPDKGATFSGALTEEDSYYFTTTLTAGRKYFVRTSGASGTNRYDLAVESEMLFSEESDPAYDADTNNTALVIYPTETGTFRFVVFGGHEDDPFGLIYRSVPVRAIGSHPFTSVSDGASAVFQPGRLVADESYYDPIVDEHLFKVSAAKGERWVFDATGADRHVQMVLYDSKGKPLAVNDTVGNESDDVRLGMDVSTKGDYYIGVYDPFLDPTDTVVCASTTFTAKKVTPNDGGTIALTAIPGTAASDPFVEGSVSDPTSLDSTRWSQTYAIGGRKGVSYRVGTSFTYGTTDLSLKAEVFTKSGTTEKKVTLENDNITPGYFIEFTATANSMYYVRVSVAEGGALDYPEFTVRTVGYAATGEALGILTVATKGAAGQWTLDKETVKYDGGASILATAGPHDVKFTAVKGFATPVVQKPTVVAGTTATVVTGVYTDTFDPRDDVISGATKLSTISAKESAASRTLFDSDPVDWFAFTAKGGLYYNFRLDDLKGYAGGDPDAVISVFLKTDTETPVAYGTDIRKLALAKRDYLIAVTHENDDARRDSSYTFVASSANVGAIAFVKNAMSVKDTAGTVKVSVRRTAKEGRVRVRYATVAGSALPGKSYVAQSGVLEWAANDSKNKDIVIKLIPGLVAVKGESVQFAIELQPFDEDELEGDEYPAQITAGTCTVTVTSSGTAASVEAAYAKVAAKLATVKTEAVALRTGTFYGVLAEDGSALTNGLPQLASVTVTSTSKTAMKSGVMVTNDTVSAKVMLAGKTYTFKTDTKNPETWEDVGDGMKQMTLKLVQKVNGVSYTNALTLALCDGWTADEACWQYAGGTAELVMNVPDANSKGAQEDIRYSGDIYRQNAKIQGYLSVVTNFCGYYTVALAPEGVSSADGIPAGNGYLTVKVDNKGTAKVTGKLADDTTISLSVTAAGICRDADSAIGYAMYLPLYKAQSSASSPYCFGGTLRLYAKPGKTAVDPAKADYEIVVDSTRPLVWNNDSAKLTYYNEDGWRILCDPVGGWYDTVVNLQAYYLNYAFEVGTADISEFPSEVLTSGYAFSTDAQPNGLPVDLLNNAFSTSKKTLVKDGKLYDLVASVNPCNVQVKFARATGIVSGSFSVWSEKEDGTVQKEVTGFSHNGVMILCRDDVAPIGEEILSAGYCLKKSIKVTDENPDTGRKTTRNWNLSLPFTLLGIDQGEPDWWDGDQGWNPQWGDKPAERIPLSS